MRERATLVNRVHKLLESANLKLGSVATDVLGVSGRSMLDALVHGQTDPIVLADMAQGRLQSKRADLERALDGRLQEGHRLILSELLVQIDSLDASIGRLSTAIEKAGAPQAEAIAHLDTIPGVARTPAEIILSQIGTAMSRFPTPAHLASWAGVCPGNHESAGKRLCGRSRPGNQALRSALVQAAWAAARTRGTYLSAQYHRLAARRGRKRALLAVAHSILVIVYRLLERDQDDEDLGANYFDERRKDVTVTRLVGRLSQLGYDVTLSQQTAAEAA